MSQAISITLKSESDVDLWRQLYLELRRLIRAGELAPGAKVPPSRELAELVRVSRKTVRQAYQQLLTEGYLESKLGSGTFVNTGIQEDELKAAQAKPKTKGLKSASMQLSNYAKAVARIEPIERNGSLPKIAFFSWRPAFVNLPQTRWTEILNREYMKAQKTQFNQVRDPRGYEPLRQSLARVLPKLRSVKCSPEQIFIVTGLQQAVDLVARMHVEPGMVVAFESPGDPLTRAPFTAYGAKILPLAVDDQGIQVETLFRKKAAQKISLAYVTPSQQFPTGAIMPLSRKLKLLAWAKERGALIFEDDYDSQFGFVDHPTPALQGLDGGHSVIYFGSFTKVLFPPFSIGYLILPERLAESYARAISIASDKLPVQLQSALANFIDKRHLEHHIKRIEFIYNQRRLVLIDELRRHFGDRVELIGEDIGLHIVVRFRTKLSDEQLVRKAAENGIGMVSSRCCYIGDGRSDEFIFAYADLTEEQIKEGVTKLRSLLTR